MITAKLVFAATVAALAGGPKANRLDAIKPGSPPVVTITARDYAYDSIADIPSGVVDLRLVNLGKTFHHAAIFKLGMGKTAADFVAAVKNPGPPPKWATPVPGPNAPSLGATSNSISELTPGNYIVMCFIDTNGGVPHFMKGMFRGFRVIPSSNRSKAPKADMGIAMFDYSFHFKPTVTSGTHIFRLNNTAKQTHEIELFLLEPGKTATDLHAWLLGPMTAKPPAEVIGGVMNVPPGSHPEFRATLTSGHYVAACFIPDAKDGKPHFLHGMEYAFEVK